MQVVSGGPPEYSSVEMLAWECDLDPDELRDYLRRAVDERSRERLKTSERAWSALEDRLEKLNGNGS